MITSNPSGYQPQSLDTNPEIDKFLMQAFRQMPAWKKAHMTNAATKSIQQWALIGIRNQYPQASTAEIRFQLAVRWLGKDVALQLYRDSDGKIMQTESIELTLKMAEIMESLAVDYLIGGSIASSILGEPRATLDVDIVADLQLSHVQPLIAAITEEFYSDEMMIRAAIEGKSSFNVIHLDTMLKVDVFVLSNQPFAQLEMQRRQQLVITQNPQRLAWFPSAEDIILQKLVWYRLGGGVSDRQWRDVLGVLKVQVSRLDFNYLTQWASTLQLEDLMTQALREAGINEIR